ncbi:MAG TPA: MopE-related protein [Polyangia bacterium]|jgi:hypothetical protein
MRLRSLGLAALGALFVLGAPACGPTGLSGGDLDASVLPQQDAARPPRQDAWVWNPDAGGRPPPCDPDDPNRLPQPEICNSVDDDCNGIIDDNVPPRANPAGCGVQVCQLGQWVDAPPEFALEICNNCDDDNDGCADGNWENGICVPLKRQDPNQTAGCPVIQKCVSGQWVNDGTSGPSTEICDGIDNDCDGVIDNIEPTPCMVMCAGTPNIGIKICQNGHEICKPNGFINIEICDGKDNDCDGLTDEGVPPEPCPCGSGQKTCQGGHMVGNCATACVLGTTRWCDDPQKCHWGKQTCVTGPDGNVWGTCVEVTERPAGCSADELMYNAQCCDAAGECCQDAFHTWQSCGHCAAQCGGQTYVPCS